MNVTTRSPRIALFTHDTFGLGHVRRCLHIVRALAERAPDAAILFITGSPAVRIFDELPQNVDYLKIPTVARTGAERDQPPHLPLPLGETTLLRSRLVREAVLGFAPDLFLVDNFPLGSRGELLPALQELRRSPTRTMLGLRDILDAPDVVRKEWSRQRIYDALDRYYDRILVYGHREILDLAEAYALPERVAARLHYCGYVTAGDERADVEADLGVGRPFLLATGGGGGDAFPLLSTLLKALPSLPPMPAVVATGPLMSAAQRAALAGLVNGRADVVLRDYVPDLRRYFATAELVVSMCGYNTAAEIMATGARAVVVPRTWRYGEHRKGDAAGVEWEQRMRAEALADLGRVRMLEPGHLDPQKLAETINAALAGPRPAVTPAADTGGLARVAANILGLIDEQEERANV